MCMSTVFLVCNLYTVFFVCGSSKCSYFLTGCHAEYCFILINNDDDDECIRGLISAVYILSDVQA